MNLEQALILAVIQGVSELFPVSSLAQTILLPALLGWDLHPEEGRFLAFVVALHLATAIALVIYFWKDWKVVVNAMLGSARRGKLVYDGASKFAWLLVAGTAVVGFLGLALEKKLREFFENPSYFWLVAVFLIANGGVMIVGDMLKKRAAKAVGAGDVTDPANAAAAKLSDLSSGSNAPPAPQSAASQLKSAEQMTFPEGTAVGAAQSLALLPGISRSGVTIVAGLLAGLTYEEASRFAFMLATPVIGLAALLKAPTLLKPESRALLHMTIPAFFVAGITAYLSVKFLMRYFRHNRLSPFGYYCIAFGIFALVMLRHA